MHEGGSISDEAYEREQREERMERENESLKIRNAELVKNSLSTHKSFEKAKSTLNERTEFNARFLKNLETNSVQLSETINRIHKEWEEIKAGISPSDHLRDNTEPTNDDNSTLVIRVTAERADLNLPRLLNEFNTLVSNIKQEGYKVTPEYELKINKKGKL